MRICTIINNELTWQRLDYNVSIHSCDNGLDKPSGRAFMFKGLIFVQFLSKKLSTCVLSKNHLCIKQELLTYQLCNKKYLLAYGHVKFWKKVEFNHHCTLYFASKLAITFSCYRQMNEVQFSNMAIFETINLVTYIF
jgi:hypothetical protein